MPFREDRDLLAAIQSLDDRKVGPLHPLVTLNNAPLKTAIGVSEARDPSHHPHHVGISHWSVLRP